MYGNFQMKASHTYLLKVDYATEQPHLAVFHSRLSNLVLLVFEAKVFYCVDIGSTILDY